jgi:hypothetical protein
MVLSAKKYLKFKNSSFGMKTKKIDCFRPTNPKTFKKWDTWRFNIAV